MSGRPTFVTDLSGSESPARAVIGAIQKRIVLVLPGGGVWGLAWLLNLRRKSPASVSCFSCRRRCFDLSRHFIQLSKSWGLIDTPAHEGRERSKAK
jgi:hypothetical protein